MIGSISAQIALLAFAAAIVAGLIAGNSAVLVLERALIALFVALVVAKIVCWTTRLVLRDHLQKKKFAIDQAHAATTPPPEPGEPGDQPSEVETG